ncbi:SEC-C metal-binding domain-containing protein [Brevibacillus fulvus]|uniref:SEC-C motif-containing protein n=1 Tax=Brevibacillus fulvus TaxID=1125967 RepID=A0A939BPX4_9BACL|nr:SEC-C metal-binding domain-containing protein [Brevibacillus fulvus]MBM7590985.1 hypothetical protein [Brevibacillus fulvus]
MSVGRNELCPCGSGKKYKKCCGMVTPITQLRSAHEQKLRKEYTSWMERLNNFVSNQVDSDSLQQARIRFAEEIGLEEQETRRMQWTAHFLNWYVFDLLFNGATLLESFVKQYGRKMEPELRRAFLKLSLGLYEIEEVSDEVVVASDLSNGEKHYILGFANTRPVVGQILVGRLLNLGLRDVLFSGSLLLSPGQKQEVVSWIEQHPEISLAVMHAENRTYTTALYRLIVQSGDKTAAAGQERLLQRVYRDVSLPELRQLVQSNPSFELKKRGEDAEIWVYATTQEGHLFPILNNTLLELHEVLAEVTIGQTELTVEGFSAHVEEIEQLLHLPHAAKEAEISKLTSTGSRLSRGTLFITSEPVLPSKVLQWAVQTYFAEKWLVTPNEALTNLAPTLAAASNNQDLKDKLVQLVERIEEESKMGQGLARFMRIDFLRPRLALSNEQTHIANLLNRPLIEGLPESVYTVHREILGDISRFVKEATEGKSEATVKKYDEVMGLFRTFVRGAFGPGFQWTDLRPEELAYFLVEDVLERVDHPTKTLAANLLSVLTAFFKWLDKQHQTALTPKFQPLFSEIKEELPEAYRLRPVFAKEAQLRLHDSTLRLQEVAEEQLLLLEQTSNGWLARNHKGEELKLVLNQELANSLKPNWLIAGLYGQTDKTDWVLLGVPGLYPPPISQMLGAKIHVSV